MRSSAWSGPVQGCCGRFRAVFRSRSTCWTKHRRPRPLPAILPSLQISDSHVGFDKEKDITAIDTLNEAIAKVKALPVKPNFMLHTGDITHLAKADQFDDARRRSSAASVWTCTTCRASTTWSMPTRASSTWSGTARRAGARAGIRTTRTGSTFHRPRQRRQPAGRRARQPRRRADCPGSRRI